MERQPKKKRCSSLDLDRLAWIGASYVLVPGVVLGVLGEAAKDGITLGTVVWALFLGLAAFFVASLNMAAAEKAGGKYFVPVIGFLAAIVGAAIFSYGVFVYLRS